jgi:hypothetical protein
VNDNKISKTVRHNQALYIVKWSPVIKADIYSITKHMPAMAGIIDLYFMDKSRVLNLLRREAVWYGGVRSRLRESIDPDLEIDDMILKKLLTESELYFRFSLCDSLEDMGDVLSTMRRPPLPPQTEAKNSGRYLKVTVKHYNVDKIIDID